MTLRRAATNVFDGSRGARYRSRVAEGCASGRPEGVDISQLRRGARTRSVFGNDLIFRPKRPGSAEDPALGGVWFCSGGGSQAWCLKVAVGD